MRLESLNQKILWTWGKESDARQLVGQRKNDQPAAANYSPQWFFPKQAKNTKIVGK